MMMMMMMMMMVMIIKFGVLNVAYYKIPTNRKTWDIKEVGTEE
jgi:hypothetical protein